MIEPTSSTKAKKAKSKTKKPEGITIKSPNIIAHKLSVVELEKMLAYAKERDLSVVQVIFSGASGIGTSVSVSKIGGEGERDVTDFDNW